jgi:oxygen tolerance protein BatD
MKRAAIILFLIAAVFAPVAQADVQATAWIEPEQVQLGEDARLTVAVEGTAQVAAPQLPRIDGLRFHFLGKTSNYRFDNSGMSGGVNYLYQVVPTDEGVFTIPEISIRSAQGTLKTPALTFRVGSSQQRRAPPVSPPAPSQTQQAPAHSAPSTAPPEIVSEPVVFQLNLPKRDFYVGELVPAELKVYLREGLNISEIFTPTLSGNAFTIGKLNNKPDNQEGQIIGGRRFIVLTWNTTIAPVQVGEYPLNSQMDVIVVEQVRRRSPFGNSDPFDDPFFDRFFGGTQQKKVTLKSKDTQVKTLSLPQENKPANFNGAIGEFEMTTDASPREVTAGDPVTLKTIVAGVGNFDRVKAPEIGKGQGFKTYSPSSKFEPFDPAGLGGRKIFEQMVIPQNPGIKSIPRIEFSYFNPDTGKYVTTASNEIPLKVAPAGPSAGKSSSTAASPAGFTASDSEVVPSKLQRGAVSSSLEPVALRPWFWGLQMLPLVGLIAAWIVVRRRDRFEKDPVFARSITASRAIQVQLDALEKALQQRNSQDFFLAARRVLQERIGERLGMKPETITPADLNDWSERVNHGSVDRAEAIRQVRGIFDVADAVAYSGQKYSAESLDEWKRKVMSALLKLEKLR